MTAGRDGQGGQHDQRHAPVQGEHQAHGADDGYHAGQEAGHVLRDEGLHHRRVVVHAADEVAAFLAVEVGHLQGELLLPHQVAQTRDDLLPGECQQVQRKTGADRLRGKSRRDHGDVPPVQWAREKPPCEPGRNRPRCPS